MTIGSTELLRRELPRDVTWSIGERHIQVQFLALQTAPLATMTSVQLHGWSQKPELWDSLFVFGGYSVPGGASPRYCLNSQTSAVFLVDPESSDTHTQILNTSPQQFIDSFNAVDSCLRLHTHSPFKVLESLRKIDPAAFEARNDWRELMEYISVDQAGA